MRRLTEIRLLLLLAVALGAAAVLGRAAAPDTASRDPRLSTRLDGPAGASAFRAALQRLRVDVSEWRRPFFDLGRGAPPDPAVMLAVLAPPDRLTLPEQRNARDWVARGGHLLLAGATGVERCFGYERLGTDSTARGIPGVVIRQVPRSDTVPPPRAVLHRLELGDQLKPGTCELLAATGAEHLWGNKHTTAALRLTFRAGGSVLLVADEGVFRNQALRDTDAGVMVFGWILAQHPRAVVVDEYHQGFGRAGSLPGAVIERVWRTPAGGLFAQLLVAGLLLLLLAAVRFGPPQPAIDRRRRSPLEHLDALAAGLERSNASRTAIALIAGGLKRRLGNGEWGMGNALPGQPQFLPHSPFTIPHSPDAGTQVMNAVNEVEDLWETLKPPTHTRS